MTSARDQRNRLQRAESLNFNTNSLVGSFFLTAGYPVDGGNQGCVVAEPAQGIFLVQLFSFLSGHPTEQKLVRIDDMLAWHFFDTAERMNAAYENKYASLWEGARETKEEGK